MQSVAKRFSRALCVTLCACLVPSLAFGFAEHSDSRELASPNAAPEDMDRSDVPEPSDAPLLPLAPDASTFAQVDGTAQSSVDGSNGIARKKRPPRAKRSKHSKKH